MSRTTMAIKKIAEDFAADHDCNMPKEALASTVKLLSHKQEIMEVSGC